MIIAYILKDCYYSSMASDLLKKNKIKYKKYLIPQDETIKTKIKKKNKMNTFPQIFFKLSNDSKLVKIGGYDELNQYIEIKNDIGNKKLNKNFLKSII